MRATDWAWAELDRFEADARANPTVDLARYLPAAEHPEYLDALSELARLDMELAAGRGSPRSADYYFARFPELSANSVAAAGVRMGEFPLSDDPPTQAIPASDLPSASGTPLSALPPSLSPPSLIPVSLPSAVADTPAPSVWPDIGDTVAGFRLTAQLGKGAFGRVYLAKQGDLAGRPVAIKVGNNLVGESHTLARLQHTNVVPIYSAHKHGRMQVVCMPYLGRTTLAHLMHHLRAGGPTVPESVRHLIETYAGGGEHTHPNGSVGGPKSNGAPTTGDVPAAQPGGGLWDRLTGGTFTDAAVWAVGQLATGLAHAHERGILHRDIKPANVLVTDDGTPMLLDFNLADDANADDGLSVAAVGGTLPYMPPEQMAAFTNYLVQLDARADLYSLGVVLYELLAGVRPYPDRHAATISQTVMAMAADRTGLPPSLRAKNPFVRPSLEALVFKLLAPEPANRYQSAAELIEDLTRYLARRPLKFAPNPSVRERVRNWAARHPRLLSGGTVGGLLGAVVVASVGGGLAIREHNRTLEARVAFDHHARELTGVQSLLDDRGLSRPQLDAALIRSEKTLAEYGLKPDIETTPAEWERHQLVRYLPADDRAKLREQVAEFYFLLGRAAYQRAKMADLPAARTAAITDAERYNRQAEAFGGAALARAVGEQRADLLRVSGRGNDADKQSAVAAATPPGSARDRFLLGFWWYQRGLHRKAMPELSAAAADDPSNFSAWFVLGTSHLTLNEPDLAAMAFTAGIALRPDFAPVHLNRGLALMQLHRPHLAVKDFDTAIKLDPKQAEPRFLRAGALMQLGKHADAEAGYTDALECADCPPRVYLYRAAARDALKDEAGAKADRAEAKDRKPTDCLGWVALAESEAEVDPKQALRDVEKALELSPLDATALQLKAHLLSERLNRPAEAVAVLDKALEHYPEHVQCLGGRAVLKARSTDRDGAHADAGAMLRLTADGPTLYQAGCVHALTAKDTPADRFKAVELLNAAIKAGFGKEHLADDPDLDPIRNTTEFEQLLEQAKVKG